MKKIVTIACFMLLVFSVKAQGLSGTWVRDNVQLKNTQTGVTQALSQEEQNSSVARWPVKLEIREDGGCVCTFTNGIQQGPSLTIDGGKVTLAYADKVFEYIYTIDTKTNSMQLIYTDSSKPQQEQIASYHQ